MKSLGAPLARYYQSLTIVEAAVNFNKENFDEIVNSLDLDARREAIGCLATFIATLVSPEDMMYIINSMRNEMMALEAEGRVSEDGLNYESRDKD